MGFAQYTIYNECMEQRSYCLLHVPEKKGEQRKYVEFLNYMKNHERIFVQYVCVCIYIYVPFNMCVQFRSIS